MATAKIVNGIVSIDVSMSVEEAEVLSAVLRKISGHPDYSCRKHTETIRLALRAANVDGKPDDSDRLGLRGSIHCESW